MPGQETLAHVEQALCASSSFCCLSPPLSHPSNLEISLVCNLVQGATVSITAFALGCCYVYAQPLLFCPPFELSSLADIAINISIMPVQGVDMCGGAGGQAPARKIIKERERERERFIREGNRAPVNKATQSRYREGPVDPRVRR